MLTLKLGSFKAPRCESSGQVLSLDWLPEKPHNIMAVGFYDGENWFLDAISMNWFSLDRRNRWLGFRHLWDFFMICSVMSCSHKTLFGFIGVKNAWSVFIPLCVMFLLSRVLSRCSRSVGSDHKIDTVASARGRQVPQSAALSMPPGSRPRRPSCGLLSGLQVNAVFNFISPTVVL